MKRIIIIISLLIVSAYAADSTQKQPFSVNALKYLLQRKEYDRFDFYIGSYLRQHPDTAILYLLKGHRYFEEAQQHQERKVYRNTYSSGSIPRKYPPYLMKPEHQETVYEKIVYDTPLIDKSFEATRRARAIEPEEAAVYWSLCEMAIGVNRPDILLHEVKQYVERFGQSDSVRNLLIEFIQSQSVTPQSSDMIQLLSAMHVWYPDNREIVTTLGKYFFHAGQTDSAYHYYMQASSDEEKKVTMVEQTVRLASCNGEFSQACSLSLNIYAISKNLLHLEQAAVFALAFDSVYAARLRAEIKSAPGYADTLSITRDLFTKEYLAGRKKLKQKFFSGDLFYLNFPLFQMRYNRSKDRIAYFGNKAGAFYVCGMHDSSAYYNLNLLRTLRHDDKRGKSVLFNLAAEYYASGKYRLSYFRFLDMCRFHNGKQDAAVRYALGLNCEKFGDVTKAKRHYRYVAQNPNKQYNDLYKLQDHAKTRLEKLQKKKNLISYNEDNDVPLLETK